MRIEEALVKHLEATPTVTAIVGTGNNARLWPLFIDQKKQGKAQIPCIVYTVVSEDRQKTYCGTSPLVQVGLAIDCYAKTLVEARRLSNAVRKELIDFRGMLGGVMRVHDISLNNSMALVDMDPGLMRVADSYNVWCVEE